MPQTELRRRERSSGDEPVFGNILCAVDGTRTSASAVRLAASLAGPDGHLTLLAVTAASGSGPHAVAAISPARVDLLLREAKRIADDAGVPSETVADPGGPPVDVILERAVDHDLLAIGAPVNSWLGGMLLGNVATIALSRFTTPMLFARRPSAGSLRGGQIVLATDGDEGSDQLVELAARLGRRQEAHVTLVHALGAESKLSPHVIERQAETLRLALPGCGEPRVEPGKPSEVILAAAEDANAGLIVIGSRRLSGVQAFGSVSRRVVHGAACSVLVVPPNRQPQ